MYIEGKACWLNHTNSALDEYNNRVHTTTCMTPFEANNQPIDPTETTQISSGRLCKSS